MYQIKKDALKLLYRYVLKCTSAYLIILLKIFNSKRFISPPKSDKHFVYLKANKSALFVEA